MINWCQNQANYQQIDKLHFLGVGVTFSFLIVNTNKFWRYFGSKLYQFLKKEQIFGVDCTDFN